MFVGVYISCRSMGRMIGCVGLVSSLELAMAGIAFLFAFLRSCSPLLSPSKLCCMEVFTDRMVLDTKFRFRNTVWDACCLVVAGVEAAGVSSVTLSSFCLSIVLVSICSTASAMSVSLICSGMPCADFGSWESKSMFCAVIV